MRIIEADDVVQHFDQVLGGLEQAPVRVQRNGKDVAVLLSPALYEMLLAEPPVGVNPRVIALHKRSLVERAEV